MGIGGRNWPPDGLTQTHELLYWSGWGGSVLAHGHSQKGLETPEVSLLTLGSLEGEMWNRNSPVLVVLLFCILTGLGDLLLVNQAPDDVTTPQDEMELLRGSSESQDVACVLVWIWGFLE